MPPSSNKVTQIDYDYIFGRATAETSYSLTEQQVALILAVSEQWHWLTRWNLFAPTSTQSDTVDALVSDLESRLTAEGPVGPIGNAPFWDDADGGDADGTEAESTYSWTERIEDWAIAAFVASSGVPGAAALYLTIAPRFRLYFKTGNHGGIIQILLDDVLYGQVDTYSPTPNVISYDVIAT